MSANPYSPDNQWLALTRLQADLPTLVDADAWPALAGAVPGLLARLAPANDAAVRLAAAVDLQDLIAPHAAARRRFLDELQIQAGLQSMMEEKLSAIAAALGVDAIAVEPSLALALQAVAAELAEPVQAADQPRLVKIGVGGVDGGQVVRLRNLTIDFKALLTLCAGIVLTRADISGAPDPLTVVSGLFLIVTGLVDGVTVELSTEEASVFWGLIQACGSDQRATESEIMVWCNDWRTTYKLPPLSQGQIDAALRRLATLRVLTAVDGAWQLADQYVITD